jgi:CheY-like chemotaxis protein
MVHRPPVGEGLMSESGAMKRPRLLFVDDDDKSVESFVRAFEIIRAYDVDYHRTVEEGLSAHAVNPFDAAVLDMSMPGAQFQSRLTKGDTETGYALARHLKDHNPDIHIFILTNYVLQIESSAFYSKTLNIRQILDKRSCTPPELVRYVDRQFGLRSHTPQAFIVHGHDRQEVENLSNFVVEKLQWERPIVLDQKVSGGLTIIEKFELNARQTDVAFILMTPDDIGGSVSNATGPQMRARQNVLFDLGYFYGVLRRKSGKVLLLRKGCIEMPSDLMGIIYVDISDGIDSASEDLIRELSAIA